MSNSFKSKKYLKNLTMAILLLTLITACDKPKEIKEIKEINSTLPIKNTLLSQEDYKKILREREEHLIDSASTTYTDYDTKIIENKNKNINKNYDRILELGKLSDILISKYNPENKSENRDIFKKIEKLKQISNSNTKYSSKASYLLGQFYEELADSKLVVKYYTKSVQFSNYDIECRKKGLKLTEKLGLKEEKKYFENKLYYGEMTIKEGGLEGTYSGVIKNNEPSYCGVFLNEDGSRYIGQYHEGHRFGYGFVYIKGNEHYYLRRYNNDGSIKSRGEKIDIVKDKRRNRTLIGEMKNNRLEGRGLILYHEKGDIFLGNFKNGLRNGEGCFIQPLKNKVTWFVHENDSRKASMNITKKK